MPTTAKQSDSGRKRDAQPASPATVPPMPPLKMAYSMRECALLMSVSYISIHRLLKRGLLRAVPHLRHKLIPHSEIERFLKV